MRVYFAGSIRGGRSDAELYHRLISYLKKNSTVPRIRGWRLKTGTAKAILKEKCQNERSDCKKSGYDPGF